jgi:TolB-like protein
MSTAKDMAKSLVANRAGQKITDSRFKQILKKEDALKPYYYKSKSSSLSKLQAKKFFNQVVSTAKGTPGLKISRLAQKIGIKPNAAKGPSNISLNKLYQKATDTQVKAQAPIGPSPEEVRRQQRHDQAIKTLHKHERADENTLNQLAQPDAQSKPASQRVAPPTMQGSVSGSTIKPTGQVTDTPSDQAQLAVKKTKEPERLALAILPLSNLSPAADRTAWLCERISKQIGQALLSEGMFILAPEPAIHGAIRRYPLSVPADHGTLRLIAKDAHVQLVAYGHLKKIGPVIEINAYLTNTQNDQNITLVSVRQETDDVFDLERRIAWQINNALSGDIEPKQKPPTPSSSEAIDLPI